MDFLSSLPFHWYGFFVGLALVVGWWLTETILRFNLGIKKITHLDRLIVTQVMAVLIGSRVWHVITDWQVYQNSPLSVFAVWQGGLSIVGAIMGGATAFVLWWYFWNRNEEEATFVLDAVAFSLPIAQAIGRLGNFVNQELYGWPSSLPWAIPISLEKRPLFLQSVERFHPLFAYEAIAMICVGALLWWNKRKLRSYFGTGLLFAGYVWFYAILRYSLDWLRPDRPPATFLGFSLLGLNQIVMVVWLTLVVSWYAYASYKRTGKSASTIVLGIVSITIIVLSTVVGGGYAVQQRQQWLLSSLQEQKVEGMFSAEELQQPRLDHSQLKVVFSKVVESSESAELVTEITVELVNQPSSLSQGLSDRDSIGSDGMLFVFPEAQIATFWMRRMHFDLDMVWIRDNQVIEITPNVPAPPPTLPLSDLPHYSPSQPADKVLELPASRAAELGIVVGNTLQYKSH